MYRQLQPQLRRLARQISEAEDYPRWQLVRTFTFARGGWHDAPLLEMPARQFRSIVDDLIDKSDEEVKAVLDAGIPEYFRDDGHSALWDMIDQWDLFPDWRRRILVDAFEAHKNGKYTLSVPALAPQIEGMLRDETHEYERGNHYIQKVNKTLGFSYSPEKTPSVGELEGAIEDLITLDLPERYEKAEQIETQHALFRVNELYNSGDFGDSQFVNSTNRHAIVHGVAEDFSELASIKLFCAVQLVHEIVDAYREATNATNN